jgi:hypothetical protein
VQIKDTKAGSVMALLAQFILLPDGSPCWPEIREAWRAIADRRKPPITKFSTIDEFISAWGVFMRERERLFWGSTRRDGRHSYGRYDYEAAVRKCKRAFGSTGPTEHIRGGSLVPVKSKREQREERDSPVRKQYTQAKRAPAATRPPVDPMGTLRPVLIRTVSTRYERQSDPRVKAMPGSMKMIKMALNDRRQTREENARFTPHGVANMDANAVMVEARRREDALARRVAVRKMVEKRGTDWRTK